ncbi:hypothetical protein AB0J83_23200 [Actinoplanes sp. NPDC049596]
MRSKPNPYRPRSHRRTAAPPHRLGAATDVVGLTIAEFIPRQVIHL